GAEHGELLARELEVRVELALGLDEPRRERLGQRAPTRRMLRLLRLPRGERFAAKAPRLRIPREVPFPASLALVGHLTSHTPATGERRPRAGARRCDRGRRGSAWS